MALAGQRHAEVANLSFLTGDAEALPFPDESFDVVINVESSHATATSTGSSPRPRVSAGQAAGFLANTDFRTAADMAAALHAVLAAQPAWTQVGHEDITGTVADAMEADDQRKLALIRQFISPRFQPLFGEFAGLVGGQMYEGFRNREILYHRFAFRKR